VSVTACLIVRNEQQHLETCLASLARWVSCIVVVDTGSTDDSIAIARRCGATVLEHPWPGHFAQARNLALDQARTEWVLYIDADETLDTQPGALDVLSDDRAIAATVSFRAARHLSCYREHRLFRNRPDLRFRGVIHETVLPDVLAIMEDEGKTVAHTDAHIEHHGYAGDITHKHRRNHPLLLQAVREDPERIYLWHALGECELALGNPAAAEAAWRSGLALVRQRPSRPADALIYADLLSLPQARTPGTVQDAQELLAEAARKHGNDPLIRWWRAEQLLQTGRTDAARELLHALLAEDAEQHMDSGLAYDLGLFGASAHAQLGQCALREGNYREATGWFERAAAGKPDNAEFRAKHAAARALAGA
jgi:Flp pilus assembly protein TadD